MDQRERHNTIQRLCGGVSHELSNFMNALSLGRQLLEQQIEDEEAGRSLNQLSHLQEQIDELKQRLDLLGLPEPNRRQPVDLRETVPQIVASLTERFDADLAGPDVDSDDPLTADVDVEAFRHLLSELVENASRQETGQPVRVSLEREDGSARLSVHDDGPGLPDDLPGPPMDPFVTSDDERLGLGLSIAGQIAAGHGGTLDVSSTSDGVTVTVALPCTDSSAPTHATG
jgi:two-component system OmpR family sensor kinase